MNLPFCFKHNIASLTLTFLMLSVLPHYASAGGLLTQVVDNKIERLGIAIDKAVKSGKITRKEAAKLQYRLEKAKHVKTEMEADGTLTQVEYYKINTVLDRIELNLKRYKGK